MEEITYENRILAIGDKPVDGNQIRSMTDKELKSLINALYKLGYVDGCDESYNEGYSRGCHDGYIKGYDDAYLHFKRGV